MWGLSLKQMCTVLTPKKSPGYSRSVSASLQPSYYWNSELYCDVLNLFNKEIQFLNDQYMIFVLSTHLDKNPHYPHCLFPDSLCQRRREQEGARGSAAHWREVQLHLPQGPRVHPHALPFPHQLWGVHQATVEHVQTTARPGVPALSHQVPQGPHGQEGGDHCSMQR